ncbi:MOSC domain-containing protein [Pontimicrobium sp. SW4]|uniref:MOSC domain-containing protein n=1 Tax=Pontimicrobium sp. SW4 TaxID=3153519 RepID=A0AAU7BUV4_9FLAO
MKIISTNIAKPEFVTINGKQQRTGIFKKPTSNPIYLDIEEVKGDEISNRKVHGGEYKACYLFSADNYAHWKNLYPQLDWYYGMLGENLTVEGLDETQLHVGDIYKVGNAFIQVTQPREPCTTFAAKMGALDIMQQFADHGKPGTYVRIIKQGNVTVGDTIELFEKAKNSISIADFFKLIFDREKNQEHLQLLVNNNYIPEKKRKELKRFLK